MAPLFVFAIFTTSFMNNNYLGGIIMAFINLIINWWNASWDTLSEVNAVLMDDGVHYY